VGGGLAYVGHFTGYTVIDVSVPAAPRIVGTPPQTQLAMHDVVANGSGLILGATSFSGTATFAVSLYDGTQPTDVTRFLTSFDTPGDSRALSIYNGLAYVADGIAGLQMLNYLPFDRNGLPPTIALSSNFTLSATAGVAEAGRPMRLTAAVTDDVQVRNVDFFVDGTRVARDGSFPFEHRFEPPAGRASFTVKACAFDTGGNSSCTSDIVITVVPDATPPRVVSVSPANQSSTAGVSEVAATFNEALDAASAANAITLIGAGADQVLDTADDVTVPGTFALAPDGLRLTLGLATPLQAGHFRAMLRGDIRDLAGNTQPSPLTWTFDAIAPARVEPLVNGATHTGVIGPGAVDTWTFQASINDSIALSVGEVLSSVQPASAFRPWIRLQNPAGVLLGSSFSTNAAQIDLRAPVTGTYTVLITTADVETGNMSYVLTLGKTPGPYTVSPGDEGGPMTNGATHTGAIGVGDVDMWTFQASANDSITLGLGEVLAGGEIFRPWIRLRGPDGAVLSSVAGANASQADLRAPVTGTYTVLVSTFDWDVQVGTMNYVLTLAKTSGPYTVSPGDEGGALTNGATHPGVIGVGDVDVWTFQASVNDSITLGLGEVLAIGQTFRPWIRLRGPDGAFLSSVAGENASQIDLRAPRTGIYTVLVSTFDWDTQVGSMNYVLTLAKTPGPYTVSPGDEGGALTNGANHQGVIGLGDIDIWTFQASVNDSITLGLGEVLVTGQTFRPWIRLRGPDGTFLSSVVGANAGQIDLRAAVTGTYTVLVSTFDWDTQVGSMSYVLTVAKTPGPYTVSPGDEGGALTNGATHPGVTGPGDIDTWTVQASANDSLTFSLAEVLAATPPASTFRPFIRLRGPDGAFLGSVTGTNAAEIDVRATLTGTYTVLVSTFDWDTQVGSMSYVLTVAKTPGPYTVSSGDEGGPMTNGVIHAGTIGVGDLDPWTFTAAQNSSLTLDMQEVLVGSPPPAFRPFIRLRGPDGSPVGSNIGTDTAHVAVKAPLTGSYTVLVTNFDAPSQVGSVDYRLTVGGACQFALDLTAASVPASDGTGTITVTAGPACPWTAVSNSPFASITAGASGAGSGTVSYSIAPNASGVQRTATLTIAAQTFTITQAAGLVAPPDAAQR
jgi:hypothetical protein